jgi:hypothetical protein
LEKGINRRLGNLACHALQKLYEESDDKEHFKINSDKIKNYLKPRIKNKVEKENLQKEMVYNDREMDEVVDFFQKPDHILIAQFSRILREYDCGGLYIDGTDENGRVRYGLKQRVVDFIKSKKAKLTNKYMVATNSS